MTVSFLVRWPCLLPPSCDLVRASLCLWLLSVWPHGPGEAQPACCWQELCRVKGELLPRHGWMQSWRRAHGAALLSSSAGSASRTLPFGDSFTLLLHQPDFSVTFSKGCFSSAFSLLVLCLGSERDALAKKNENCACWSCYTVTQIGSIWQDS